MQYWASPSDERRRRRKKNNLVVLVLSGSVLSLYFSAPLGVLLVMETLEDGWYVAINAYQFTVFEIWRDFFVLSYIACPRYPYIRVYRLYDTYLPLPLDSQPAANTWNTGQGFITLLKDMNLIVTLLNSFSLWSMSVFTMANRAQIAQSYKQPVITWCYSLGGEICYSVLL